MRLAPRRLGQLLLQLLANHLEIMVDRLWQSPQETTELASVWVPRAKSLHNYVCRFCDMRQFVPMSAGSMVFVADWDVVDTIVLAELSQTFLVVRL